MFFLFFVFLFLSLWMMFTSFFAWADFNYEGKLGFINSALITCTVFFAAMAFNW